MTVSEVRIELSNLQDQHVDLQRRLEQLIESGDDPDAIMVLQKAINQNAVRQYAAKSKIIRLTKRSHQDSRELAIADRDELEKQLQLAAIAYDKTLQAAEDARVAYQTIALKLGSLDSRIESDRLAISERQKELGQHIANWKRDSMIDQLSNSVCDY